MRKTVLAAMLFVASNGLCQTPAKDSDTLQSLLMEVRQLRQAIEAMTAAAQRVQIALSALQMQDAVVARAAQRLDDARNKCAGAEAKRQHMATEIQELEGMLVGANPGEARTKAAQLQLARTKSEIEPKAMDVQTCRAAEAEASSQLRNDQAKLVDLQDRIERLDKTL